VTDADSIRAAPLSDLQVAVVGYGIQGRAFAANLRDSGVNVLVGNRDDGYRDRARQDGFAPLPILEAIRKADISILLIPDDAHREVFDLTIRNAHQPHSLLLLAHGYSMFCGDVQRLPTLDLALLAPRMYGDPLRQSFISGRGSPAYIDIIHDTSGRARERTLAIATKMLFTRAGLIELDFAQETILDLFQEQFIAPALVEVIERGFEVLRRHGFDARAALLESYASGEMGQMLLDGARYGLHKIIQSQGSPTCQLGFGRSLGSLLSSELEGKAESILHFIQNGEFSALLRREASAGYPFLSACNAANERRPINQAHRALATERGLGESDLSHLYRPAAVE
jgi:ketol-acid reductoisomerase